MNDPLNRSLPVTQPEQAPIADSNSAHLVETFISPLAAQAGQPALQDLTPEPARPASPQVQNSSATTSTPADEPLTRIGRYVIQGELGKGAFGKVLLAFDETLRRKVAIKAPRLDVSDKVVEREFLTEARQLAQLKHAGIVGVLDVVSDSGRCYIISDFVDGPSLSKWLKKTQPDWKRSAQICASIADALAHAHSHRTVHRDLKPANVIMTADNQPVIVDFGLSLSDSHRAEGTSRGDISGTPQYMSPEQASGAGHRIDGRTDIYSLGVILYRMLVGRVPFDSSSVVELLRQVQEDEPQPPRQLNRQMPAELERICLKAMAKSLRERYTTADDMAHDLRTLLASAGPSEPIVSIDLKSPSQSQMPGTVKYAGKSPEVSDKADEDSAKTDAHIRSATIQQPRADAPVPQESAFNSAALSRRRLGSQRRQVTIASCGCDVFENEAIQESQDDDEQAALLQAFQKFGRELASEFGGSVLNDTDDGVAICFGFPLAYEDSVPRALRFGLALLQRMNDAKHLWRTMKMPLGARVVMHTDVAVVETQASGDDSMSSVSVVGTVRNYTSRLEQAAELGVVMISEQTHRLLKGLFETETLGQQRIKGLPGPVSLYRVVRERSAASRVDLAEPAALTPLIGRDREVGLLQERWEQAAEGMGQVVLIIGEAGLGKSRLVHALKRHVLEQSDGNGDPIVEWRSSQQRQSSSLYPAIECFERLLGFDRDDSAATQLEKLVTHLNGLNLDGDHEIALLASLLSIPLQGQYPELNLPPQVQHEQTNALLLDWLQELSLRHPLLFVIEDLHWVDPSTLQFVEQLVDRGLNDRILTLLTFRPEFETPWKSKAHQTNLALNRLTKRQIQEMMEQKAHRRLPMSLVEQIIERTDGVPLFVEEYTQMVVEADVMKNDGDSSISGINAIKQIPASLQDMLMSRLDRIDCDLAVVQLAATIGRTFPFELIRAAAQPLASTGMATTDDELQKELDKLVAAELLFVQGRAPRQRYQFKHALLQDAAYNSLVKAKRQEFHGQTAAALDAHFPDVCEKEPEVVAQHFSEAGLPD